MTEPAGPRTLRKGCAAVAAAAALSHATALRGGYIWLDHTHIEEGLAIATPSDWPSLFTRGFAGTGFYRPFMALSLSADAALSKTPELFRAVTLAWHAAASTMVVVAARALGLSFRPALAAGLLFAVHPATSLVASATAFRSEAMIVVFLLLLVWAHLRGKAILAGAALFAGALTKETAWVLGPLFVAALEVRRGRSVAPGAVPRNLLVGEVLGLIAATGLRLAYAPEFRASHAELPWVEALGARVAALGKSALTLLSPLDQGVCDAFPVTPITSPSTLLGTVALGAIGWLAWRGGVKAWLFVLALLPSLQLVPVMRWWSPHYLYVPLAFGAMLLAGFVDEKVTRPWRAVLAVAIPCAALSLHQGASYASDLMLWGPEVAREPACREGHFFLGETAREARDWGTAAVHYEKAAVPVPGYLSYADELSALQNLGAVRLEQEQFQDARAAWSAALERDLVPEDRRRLVHNVATLSLRTGDPANAARLLAKEGGREDALPESLFVLAKALHELGRDDEARDLVRRLQGSR